MFTSIVGISDRYIRTKLSKNALGYLKVNQKGYSVGPEEIKTGMCEHLATIPTVESDYKRIKPKKMFKEERQ